MFGCWSDRGYELFLGVARSQFAQACDQPLEAGPEMPPTLTMQTPQAESQGVPAFPPLVSTMSPGMGRRGGTSVPEIWGAWGGPWFSNLVRLTINYVPGCAAPHPLYLEASIEDLGAEKWRPSASLTFGSRLHRAYSSG